MTTRVVRMAMFARNGGYEVVRVTVGLVLLVAAGLKGEQLVNQPHALMGDGVLDSPWLLMPVVAGEVFLGFCLLARMRPRLVWTVAVACFAVFAAVSCYKALAGEPSCGCFGRVPVNPWITFLGDVAVVAMLWSTRGSAIPRRRGGSWGRRLDTAGALAVLLVLGLATGLWTATHRPSRIVENGEVVGASRVVVLEPREWIGKRCPLLEHIDIGARLSAGDWNLLLVHSDCRGCEQALSEFGRLASEKARGGKGEGFAVVEVPSEVDVADRPQLQAASCERARLSDDWTWFVKTPVGVRLRDGVALEVLSGVPSQVAESGKKPEEKSATATAHERAGATMPTRIFSAAARGFPDYQKARRDQRIRATACGPLAVIAILDHFALSPTPEERERILGAATPDGTSLLEVQELVEAQGLHTLPVSLTADSLRQLALPAIVHLNGATFVAVTAYPDEGFEVVYPMSAPAVVPEDRFRSAFEPEGHALLISQRRISARSLGLSDPSSATPPHGPALRLGRSFVSVGRIYSRNWEASLPLTNDGDEPLRILSVQSSCGCMTPAVDRTVIEPLGSATLRVKGVQDAPGVFARQIAIKTNQASQPDTVIVVRGHMECPIFLARPVVDVGEVLQGEAIALELPVELADGVDPGDVKATFPVGAPLSFDAVQRRGGELWARIDWKADVQEGWQTYTVEMTSNKIPGCAAVKVYIGARVIPKVDVFPPIVWVRSRELAAPWHRQVTFSHHGEVKDWRIEMTGPRDAQSVEVICDARSDPAAVKAILGPKPGNRVRDLPGSFVTVALTANGKRLGAAEVWLGDQRLASAAAPKGPDAAFRAAARSRATTRTADGS